MSTAPSTFNWVGTERRVCPVREQQRDPLTELDRRVWQLLHDQGGYWTWAEVRAELQLHDACDRGPSPLMRLFNRCHVARRNCNTCSGTQWAYGVTLQCDPLPPPAQPRVPVFLQAHGQARPACA